MARLTKTERDLLNKATRKPTGGLYAQTWWSTGEKGDTIHGTRTANALKNLVAAGLADSLKIDSNSGPTIGGESTVYSTEFSAKITDAGREAVR